MATSPLRLLDMDGDFDPWELGTANYSPSKIYTRSVDKKGHGEVLHVKLPPDLMARAAEIVAAKAFPDYRTPHDIVRDALVHRLKYMADVLRDDELQRRVTIEMRNCEIEGMLRELEQLQTHVKLGLTLLKQAKDSEDEGMVERFIVWAEAEVEELREPYAGEVRKMLGEARKVLKQMNAKDISRGTR